MKAAQVQRFGGPEVLQYVDMDIPVVDSNQVLIRVNGTSVNFADIKMRKGQYPGVDNTPLLPGLDATGTIEAVGRGVTTLKEGQRVIAFPSNGSYAEFIAADENLTFVIPETIDLETAAAFPIVSFAAFNLLYEAARMAKGETVVIHAAAGGVGTTAVQFAKLLGAAKVIGTVGKDEKITTAQKAGADYVINYEKEDFADRVQEITGGKGADVILDSIGGHVFQKSLECLAKFGRIVNYGNASGQTGHYQTNFLYVNNCSVIGYSLGSYRKYRPEALKGTAEKVIPYLANGQIKIVIGNKFELKDAAKAHEWIENRNSIGKVILIP